MGGEPGFELPVASYPTSVAADAAFGLLINNTSKTLAVAIIDSTLSIVLLEDISDLPSTGIITIDQERILYSSKNNGAKTLIIATQDDRGFDNSTATSHLSGAAVRFHITAHPINRLVREVQAIQLQLGATGLQNFLRLDGTNKLTNNLTWQSGTANDGIFDHSITATRTWTFPDMTGTVALLENAQTITGVKTFNAEPVFDGNLTFKSGTASLGTLDHAITAPRTWVFPDASGIVAVMDVNNAGNLKWASGTAFAGTLDHSITADRTWSFQNATYTVAGTDIAQSFTAAQTFTDATSPIITAKLGPSGAQQHTLPAVASDTVGLLAASQAFTNKTYNGLTVTPTTGTFTLTNGKTLSAANTLSLAGVDGTTLTFQGTDTYIGRATTDTLTNKSLSDSTTFLVDNGDVTKRLQFSVTGTSGITGILQTAFTTAKTISFPDAAGTIALLERVQTFTVAQTFADATSPIISAKIGPSGSEQHSIPAVASDTLALLAAPQTFSGAKTFTGGAVFTTTGLTVTDVDVVLSATTGTKIGTATTQKLGFYNATPIVQPVGTTDLRQALINLGLYASGGATPLNLNGGALIAQTGTISSLTSGRVVLAGASGLLGDDADFTFNGTQLALASQGSSGGVLMGGDAHVFRGGANRVDLGAADHLHIPSGDARFDDATKGVVLKDTQGTPHYWRVTVNNSGQLVTADLGTSLPAT